jgi:phosphatidate cytidylyltransferase
VLKLRVLTALVLAPLVIFATLALPHSGFAFVAALIFAVGAWEWAGLSSLSASGRLGYAGFVAALFAIDYSLMTTKPDWILPLLGLALVWWALALTLVVRFPASGVFWSRSRAARSIAGLAVLVPAWVGLVLLHGTDPYLALMTMVLVSFADIGAYFAGRAFGRHKLAPEVSPGKTWEGLMGALAVTALIGYGATYIISLRSDLTATFVLLCLATVLASVVGDLVESMFKRLVGAKDSSNLLPGHGGVLDRMDSLTAAAPVFAVGVHWLKVVA